MGINYNFICFIFLCFIGKCKVKKVDKVKLVIDDVKVEEAKAKFDHCEIYLEYEVHFIGHRPFDASEKRSLSQLRNCSQLIVAKYFVHIETQWRTAYKWSPYVKAVILKKGICTNYRILTDEEREKMKTSFRIRIITFSGSGLGILFCLIGCCCCGYCDVRNKLTYESRLDPNQPIVQDTLKALQVHRKMAYTETQEEDKWMKKLKEKGKTIDRIAR
ncbi:hypothetical protein SNEBB_004668 [Seison nebaliae]|nr:hypothetical protein SNEBB_004668 [Seison nebaliae]